jgi:hypothetical protein
MLELARNLEALSKSTFFFWNSQSGPVTNFLSQLYCPLNLGRNLNRAVSLIFSGKAKSEVHTPYSVQCWELVLDGYPPERCHEKKMQQENKFQLPFMMETMTRYDSYLSSLQDETPPLNN